MNDKMDNGIVDFMINLFPENESLFNVGGVVNDKGQDEYINKTNKTNDNYRFSQPNLLPIDMRNAIFDDTKKNKKRSGRKKNKNKTNKLKKYNIIKGDWLCPFCNNINFSFRTVCNICGVNKLYKENNQQEPPDIMVI